MLDCGSNIFQDKGHHSISKCAPTGCKHSLVLIFLPDLIFVVSKETIHEGKYLMTDAFINDLVNKRSWEVVLGTCQIQIVEVCIYVNGALFLIRGNRVGNPNGIRNGVNEAFCA